MKLFITNNGEYGEKVNFVDKYNRVLGYDLGNNCCELADWFIADKPIKSVSELQKDGEDNVIFNKEIDFEEWIFDGSFLIKFKEDNPIFDEEPCYLAIFRIQNGDKEKFIHLFNCQNGYYSHGFSFVLHEENVAILTQNDKELEEKISEKNGEILLKGSL